MIYSEKEQRLLALLKSNPTLNTHELRQLDFFTPNALIHSLRKKGVPIKTERGGAIEQAKMKHKRMAYYSLKEQEHE